MEMFINRLDCVVKITPYNRNRFQARLRIPGLRVNQLMTIVLIPITMSLLQTVNHYLKIVSHYLGAVFDTDGDSLSNSYILLQRFVAEKKSVFERAEAECCEASFYWRK